MESVFIRDLCPISRRRRAGCQRRPVWNEPGAVKATAAGPCAGRVQVLRLRCRSYSDLQPGLGRLPARPDVARKLSRVASTPGFRVLVIDTPCSMLPTAAPQAIKHRALYIL
ncbi:hypothetical protein LIA77_02531 [Sarocladium implicatum]|nr:hypothetical protein LIA77_02531 [Sarocladium implicatum]